MSTLLDRLKELGHQLSVESRELSILCSLTIDEEVCSKIEATTVNINTIIKEMSSIEDVVYY